MFFTMVRVHIKYTKQENQNVLHRNYHVKPNKDRKFKYIKYPK